MQDYKKALDQDRESLIQVIKKIVKLHDISTESVNKIIYKNPGKKTGIFSKGTLLNSYRYLKENNEFRLSEEDERVFFQKVRMKKIRTLSGVTPVTVLTKPYYCPGNCIFCPKDENMPKSYLSSEPGAQRALANKFDPYLQVFNRLVAYKKIGHPTDKIELIILGGTWSSYDKRYQIWFVKRCFDAMNDFNLENDQNQIIPEEHEENKEVSWNDLYASHKKNETATTRCIGMVIETRPDSLDEKEILRIRKLGVTKVQIGVQSLNDKVLYLNKRGHDVRRTKKAFELLRKAGFKIHAHWMPNLYGSSPKKDVKDFKKLFKKDFRPDELKIYPCSLIESAQLMDYYNKDIWKPYDETTLLSVLKRCLILTPRYCRVTRMVRDISSDDIFAGNKKTNFRQLVESSLKEEGKKLLEIRFREVRGKKLGINDLNLKITKYKTSVSIEYFLEYVTKDDQIAGFLRLSLPKNENYIEELNGSAIIREVHVYGQSLELGKTKSDKVQHSGIGKNLIKKAEKIAKEKNYSSLSVISSIGTREYYRKQGFLDGTLYQSKTI